MKTVLMVAAGVAVGLTVVLAVLVQTLVQLAPVLVALAVAILVLHLVRRSRQRQTGHVVAAGSWAPRYTTPPPAPIPAPSPAALPAAGAPVEDLYLHWGPAVTEHAGSTTAITTGHAGTPVRGARAPRRPSSGDVRGRRP